MSGRTRAANTEAQTQAKTSRRDGFAWHASEPPASNRSPRIGAILLGTLAMTFAAACGSAPPKPAELDADPPLSNAPSSGPATTEVQRAAAFIKNEKWDEAKSHLDQALAAQPNDAQGNYYMGVVKEKLGDRDGATENYKKAIAADPGLVEASNNLAAIYLDNPPRPDDAIPVLKKALEKSPDDVGLHRNLAYAEGLKGDLPAASKEYEALLAKNDDPAIRLDYSTLLFDKKDFDNAAGQLKKTLAKAPDDAPTLATIGLMLGFVKAYPECVHAYDRALKLKADSAELMVHRGICRHGLKDEAGASADFEAAVKTAPKSAAAHYYLGEALIADKKRSRAYDELTTAVNLAGDSEIGKRAKAKLATLGDMADKRKALLKK
jgi:tetratricopeptide (TPR) repeat protein